MLVEAVGVFWAEPWSSSTVEGSDDLDDLRFFPLLIEVLVESVDVVWAEPWLSGDVEGSDD